MGNHVNLLATVSLKTEYHLPEIAPMSGGKLVISLKQHYEFKKLNCSIDLKLSAPQWLKNISTYLVANELASDLFTGSDDPNDFVATFFALGKY